MKYVVKRSKIHGKGLFSTRFIPQGTLLGKCQAVETRNPNGYTLWLDEETNKMVDVVCQFKYINHSELPNVAYCDDLSVIALNNIKKGTELTHNYEGETNTEVEYEIEEELEIQIA